MVADVPRQLPIVETLDFDHRALQDAGPHDPLELTYFFR